MISGRIDSSEPVTTRLYSAGADDAAVEQRVQADGERELVRSSLEHDERQQEVVPDRDELEQEDRSPAPGTIIGTAIRANSRPSRQPSTRADSITSSGTAASA